MNPPFDPFKETHGPFSDPTQLALLRLANCTRWHGPQQYLRNLLYTHFLTGHRAWTDWLIHQQLPAHPLLPGNPKPHAQAPNLPIVDLLQQLNTGILGACILSRNPSATLKVTCKLVHLTARQLGRKFYTTFDTPFHDLEPNDHYLVCHWKGQVSAWLSLITATLVEIRHRTHLLTSANTWYREG